jgi:hypothetical protein
MMTPSRRGFMGAAAVALSGAATNCAVAPSPANAADVCPVDAMAAEISAKLFADDGMARPVPETPTVSDLAKGLDRTLVLGGGGEYYVAWYCGFFHGLFELDVDLNVAEMVVGTSAGAYAGSSLTSGHFQHLRREFDFFGHFPSLFAKLAPLASPNISQKRAREINFNVKNGDPASIRAIGHAALAADNQLNGPAVERLAALLTDDSKTGWPVAKMYTTANDCYSGERLVIGQAVARKNARPRDRRQLVAARRNRPDLAWPAVLHGWRHLQNLGAHRSRRRLQARACHHPDQWIRGQPAEWHSAQHLQRDRRSAGDRDPGYVDDCRYATRGEPAGPRRDRAGATGRIPARQGRSRKDQEILVLTLLAETTALRTPL